MAKQAQLSGVVEGDFVDIDGKSEDISALQDDLDSDMRAFLSEMNTDPNDEQLVIKVFKEVKGQRKPAHCFNGNFSDLPIDERLRKDFGSGEYIVNLIKDGKLFRKFRVPILAPATPAAGGDLANILKAMSDQNQAMFAQIRQMATPALASPPKDQTETMKEMLQMMVLMKSVMSPPENQGSKMGEFLEMLKTVKELIPEASGKETGLYDVVKDVLGSPIFGAAISNAMQPKTPQAARIAAPQPLPQGEAEPAQVQQPEEQPQMNSFQQQMAKVYISNLVQSAKAGSEAELYAEVIVDQLPEPVIRENLLTPDAIDRAATLVPEVNNYRPWFKALQESLIKYLSEPSPVQNENT